MLFICQEGETGAKPQAACCEEHQIALCLLPQQDLFPKRHTQFHVGREPNIPSKIRWAVTVSKLCGLIFKTSFLTFGGMRTHNKWCLLFALGITTSMFHLNCNRILGSPADFGALLWSKGWSENGSTEPKMQLQWLDLWTRDHRDLSG